MTGHSAPKVVQYRSIHLPPEAVKVDDLAEGQSPFEMGEHLSLRVIYTGMVGELAAVYIEGHGNFAVPLSFLGVRK